MSSPPPRKQVGGGDAISRTRVCFVMCPLQRREHVTTRETKRSTGFIAAGVKRVVLTSSVVAVSSGRGKFPMV